MDLAKAAKYAALSGDSAVLYETADRLETLGAEPETRDALYRELLKKDREGAQLGIQACLTLARMYEKGRGTRPDGRSAERLLRRAMELEKQQAMAEPRAEMQLAELYEAGAEGLPADHAAARRLLQTVAKGGSEVARLRYIRLCTQDGCTWTPTAPAPRRRGTARPCAASWRTGRRSRTRPPSSTGRCSLPAPPGARAGRRAPCARSSTAARSWPGRARTASWPARSSAATRRARSPSSRR